MFFSCFSIKKIEEKDKGEEKKRNKRKKRTELQKMSKVWMSDIEIFTIISFIIFTTSS